jgi:hypothetical protein
MEHMKKNIKIAIFILAISLTSALIHNAIYAVFKIEEPVFFTIALLLIPFFFVYLIYSSIKFLKK